MPEFPETAAARTSGSQISGNFDGLVKEYTAWAEATFGSAEGNPRTRAELLRREVKELVDEPTDRGEMADVLLTLIWLADTQGVNLVAEGFRKLAVLRARSWGIPDEHFIAHHIA